MAPFQIRPMTRDELGFAIDAAGAEGWNPGLHDQECFFATDPEGFLVGRLGERPVGCISAISYEGRFGFLGFYIVLPEFRGRGYGIQLWRAAMARLAGHNVGLDGVVDQQPNYVKSGFRLAYRNIRYQWRARPASAPTPRLVPLAQLPFHQLSRYDRGCFPAPREPFLRPWIAMPGTIALGLVDQGTIRGYGVLRPCRQGYKIGPLFADGPEIAEELLQGLTREVEGPGEVFLDVPEVNPRARELAERHGMVKVFETARMYTGEDPPIPLERIYGVTTFELG